MSTYVVVEYEGIYEVVEIDNYAVVQTNIRTFEKAVEACRTWQRREAERGRKTEV
jgi:hypothetical protein